MAQQINYLGILEAVRVRKQGFSEKLTFEEFAERYRFTVGGKAKRNPMEMETIDEIERQLKTKFQRGTTRLFLKADQSEQLKKMFLADWERRIRLVNKVQQAFVRYKGRKAFKRNLARIAGTARLVRFIDKAVVRYNK